MSKTSRERKRLSREENIIQNAPYLDYEQRIIGIISDEYLGSYSDKVSTKEVIITTPVIKHIFKEHPDDFVRIMEGIDTAIAEPSFVFEDNKDKDTLLFVRELNENNQKVVVALNTRNDKKHPLNSVITSYIIGPNDLERLTKNNYTVFER